MFEKIKLWPLSVKLSMIVFLVMWIGLIVLFPVTVLWFTGCFLLSVSSVRLFTYFLIGE